MKKFFILTILLLSITSCVTSQRLGSFTVMSDKNIKTTKTNLNKAPQIKNISGEDSKLIILSFPLGTPKFENALDNLLEKGDGDIAVDVSSEFKSWYFLIVGQNKIVMKGTVINSKGGQNE
ncbi:MAG: hypothetical protein PHY80_03700 [Rickettsiales bacterium]|nr:hypothetical protein [Rickettsiales bacterium]